MERDEKWLWWRGCTIKASGHAAGSLGIFRLQCKDVYEVGTSFPVDNKERRLAAGRNA